MRAPVEAERLLWRQLQTIYSLRRLARTRADAHPRRCHGYIKAEAANFDQLLTVME